ncbi:NfeD family protein [Rubripirellula tenax]|nr:NfeD family protein [Rubripirellula tenax]
MVPWNLSKSFCLTRIAFALIAVAFAIVNVRAADDLASDGVKTGQIIDIPDPMTGRDAEGLVDQLRRISEAAAPNTRVTVVLHFSAAENTGETMFEDALRLSRALSSDELRQVRVVALVNGEVSGHLTLPILASDLMLVGPDAVIANAARNESGDMETIALVYDKIARRRGLFPPAVVAALVDPETELALVSSVGGQQSFAAGDELEQLRSDGSLVGEDVYSAAGQPLRLDARQLRRARIAAGQVDSIEDAAEWLDLAELNAVGSTSLVGDASGVLLEITGSVAGGRARRWQSNLDSTLGKSSDVNTWLISIDSNGGNFDDSTTLAASFSNPQPPLRTVAGFIRGEARGDASLIALSCKPLWIKPDARLGGPGAATIVREDLDRYDELIEQIASSTKRPAALIRGLLVPELETYRYTHKKTGRVRYATDEDIIAGAASADDQEIERATWQRGERILLDDGLTSAEAVSLGLADGESESLEDVSRRLGLAETPMPVSDRGLVRLVERLGRNATLSFLLLFIGFAALSAEANAPGATVPAFIALVCFALFFWMKFLAGTAEWLELVALSVGLICIAIELFVVPGFGVFGIGGLALTVLGVVLMTQTFVIPQNVYQLNLFAKGVWLALGGAAGMVGGFILMRIMLPHVPLFRSLVMEASDTEALNESEKLGDYGHLMGRVGTATTPLRPSGKAKFGDEIVQVISDGTSCSTGDSVRVISVQATKVIVELGGDP